MSISRKVKLVAVSVALLAGILAVTAPASASQYLYRRICTVSSRGTICYYLRQSVSQPTKPITAPPTTKPTPTPAPSPSPTNPVQSTSGLTAAEQQMLNLVNQERSKAGLSPLQADLQLTQLARMKSQDMISKNYFSHQSPTYGSPFDMMKRYGVTYRTAGENIAGNRSVEAAHTALMNSSGHRANILSKNFTHVGIGIVQGGSYGTMFTQMFVGR